MVGVQGVKGVDSHVLVICLLQHWRKKRKYDWDNQKHGGISFEER